MFARAFGALTKVTVLGAAALLLTGCSGDDNKKVTAPVDDSPAAVPAEMLGSPQNMRHQGHPLGDMVQWDVPTDAAQDDVMEYRVYQYDPDPGRTEAYVLVATSDRGRLFVDDLAVGSDYTFRVRGVNMDGVEGEWSTDLTFEAMGPVAGTSGPRPGMEEQSADPHTGGSGDSF